MILTLYDLVEQLRLRFTFVLWLLPSMLVIGVALVMQCITSSAKEDQSKAVLSVYIVAKYVLAALHYQQDRAH